MQLTTNHDVSVVVQKRWWWFFHDVFTYVLSTSSTRFYFFRSQVERLPQLSWAVKKRPLYQTMCPSRCQPVTLAKPLPFKEWAVSYYFYRVWLCLLWLSVKQVSTFLSKILTVHRKQQEICGSSSRWHKRRSATIFGCCCLFLLGVGIYPYKRVSIFPTDGIWSYSFCISCVPEIFNQVTLQCVEGGTLSQGCNPFWGGD